MPRTLATIKAPFGFRNDKPAPGVEPDPVSLKAPIA